VEPSVASRWYCFAGEGWTPLLWLRTPPPCPIFSGGSVLLEPSLVVQLQHVVSTGKDTIPH
jgi:hypothetical protein